MARRRIELPNTVAECHKLILELYAKLDELEDLVAQLRRELYGSRRERFIVDESAADDWDRLPPSSETPATPAHESGVTTPSPDGSIRLTPWFPEADLNSPVAPASPTDKQPRTSSGRRPRIYDPTTPREKVYHRLNEHDVPPEILNHPHARRFFRYVREEVELPQRRLRIIEHYQEVIVVDDALTLDSTVSVASVPEPLLDRCYVGPSLLSYLAVSRFADHIPYYREEDILRRSGLSIHRSTQWRWMHGLSQFVLPLVTLIRERLLCVRVLGIDETPCPLIDPDLAHTRKAYLYAQYGDDTQPYVCYYFASHKTRDNIQAMLQGFHGVLQSDAYICYELIAEASCDQIKPAACWAHGRRKFEPLVANGPHPQASWVLRQIQKLYDIEDRAHDTTNEARCDLRQAESRPIVAAIRKWLDERHAHELPRSPLREGLNYFRNRWEAFTRFLEDGAIPLDNNRTEAAIKGPVMGKKAWLFFGNEVGGETAATLYTLMMSCKRHGIDPHAYLVDVMRRIKNATPDELESLLPDRWLQEHPEAQLEQRARESHAAAHRKRVRRAARRATAAKR